MKPETEQLLGTLEVIADWKTETQGEFNLWDLMISEGVVDFQPFLWETDQGEFNLWNLMNSEGVVSLTDLEVAFEHWQNIERWGTPTDQTFYEYAPLRSERMDDWNEAIATERQGYYQQLQQLLTTHLQNIQAYNLSVSNSSHDSSEYERPNFSVSVVVGETRDHHWLCLAPTVPDQIGLHERYQDQSAAKAAIVCEPLSDTTQTLVSQIRLILDKLNPIPLYGYYYGGYDYTYEHKIVCAASPTKADAIEQALSAVGILVVSKLDSDRGAYNIPKLYQFLTSSLQDVKVYQLSFWDIGYIYEVGKAATGDWLGVSFRAEFQYNP